MRVLVVGLGTSRIVDENSGGADLYSYHLANGLGAAGVDVEYIIDAVPGTEFHPNVTVHQIGAPVFPVRIKGLFGYVRSYFRANIHSYRRARSVIKAANDSGRAFDVVHAIGPLTSFLLKLFVRKQPMVYTCVNPTPWMCEYPTLADRVTHTLAFRLVELPMLKRVQRVISLTSPLKVELERAGVDNGKIDVIRAGLDMDRFAPVSLNGATPHPILTRSGLTEKDYCLFVGQLVKRKGVHHLLNALKSVDLPCLIVGDGPEHDHLVQLAKDLGIDQRVTFAGSCHHDELPEIYSRAKFFVMPTVADLHPVVLMESLGCGTPVIATDIGVAPEIIKNGQNGYIVPPANVAALADRIAALAANSEARIEMGRAARATAVAAYNWDAMAQRVIESYEKAVGEPALVH